MSNIIISKEVINNICTAIENGAKYGIAIKAHKINSGTGRNWKSYGKRIYEGLEDGTVDLDSLSEVEHLYYQLYVDVMAAESKYTQKLLNSINVGIVDDANLAYKMLKVYNPEEYNDNHNIKHQGNVDVRVSLADIEDSLADIYQADNTDSD